jgi:hypothetical protein
MSERLRQFSYVSPPKLAALEAQLARRLPLRPASATVSLLGAEVSVSGESGEQREDLVRRTLAVERKLRRRKLVSSLPEEGELDPSRYYVDEATWWHGLFAFSGDFSLEADAGRVVSYMLWRPWLDSIVLLAGAPENVLGERVARDGVWAYGTTGTWATILRFAETTFASDEPGFETVTGAPPSSPAQSRDVAPSGLFDAPRGLALAVICARHLSTLPESRVETTFRVSQRFPIRTPGLLPRWAAEALGSGWAGDRRIELVRRCKAVYVGSPLYTALV